ncbi:hypothetical protein RCF19_29985 [Rhodococcus qingshengii]
MTETISRTAALANGLLALHRKNKITILPTATGGTEDAATNLLAALDAQGIELVPADSLDGDAGDLGSDDCDCPVATLETAFRPHEVLVGALDTLSELGVIALESDIDVVAARLLAALDDVGATVVHYDDTEPDERPRDIPAEDLWLTCIRLLNKQMGDRIEKKCADDISAFDIPNIPSQPWWTVRDLDRYRAWLSESPANAWDMGGINVQTGGGK